ncbi:hypothetical protein AACH06_25620 [Ideonella sp. DXS29W]|uniref:Uncharacterized protein n=1 Tax=Ideonella lacteola TaxID=2984193 RepID=A0ABU9C058_9BURK
MNLRRKIEAAVAAAMAANPGDAKAAALEACAAFEWEVEVGGNGWWDDDQEFLAYSRDWMPPEVRTKHAGG